MGLKMPARSLVRGGAAEPYPSAIGLIQDNKNAPDAGVRRAV